MVSIKGKEDGPIQKPPPKPRGGRKPKDAGRRYERQFASRYGMQRQVGSGAFGLVDPMLKGDVKGEIGSTKILLELKSLEQYDGKGERTISFPAAWLKKIEKEAESLNRAPIFIYHLKNDTEEWAVVKWSWLLEQLLDKERQIALLTQELLELQVVSLKRKATK